MEKVHLSDLLKNIDLKLVLCDDVRDAEVINGEVVEIKKEHPKCSACGREFELLDEMENFSFDKYIGHDSIHDGEHIKFQLCCSCFDQIFNIIKPMIKNIEIEKYNDLEDSDSIDLSDAEPNDIKD